MLCKVDKLRLKLSKLWENPFNKPKAPKNLKSEGARTMFTNS